MNLDVATVGVDDEAAVLAARAGRLAVSWCRAADEKDRTVRPHSVDVVPGSILVSEAQVVSRYQPLGPAARVHGAGDPSGPSAVE